VAAAREAIVFCVVEMKTIIRAAKMSVSDWWKQTMVERRGHSSTMQQAMTPFSRL
jgi:hypothetical protein